MKTKTYKFFIERNVLEAQQDGKLVLIKKIYPCKVNAACPPDHRMLR